MAQTNTETPPTLSLRDIASWQFPALATDSQGRPHRPKVLAGLPSLQRGAVWRPNQVERLWDSILRGFPIGSLVVTPKLKGQATSTGIHAARQDTDSSRPADALPWGDDYTDHLLDGQQRANAIALGYLDPFAPLPDGQEPPHTLLWLDLAPQGAASLSLSAVSGFESSTCSYLLRVTTQAHPWGFEVSNEDAPQRLEHWQAKEANAQFLGESNPQQRALPHQGWPIKANAPVPLAWVLEEAHQILVPHAAGPEAEAQERRLWEAVCKRCAAQKKVPNQDAELRSLRFTHWAQRVEKVFNDWLNAATLPAQAQHLARGLRRALQARMVALAIAPEALAEPYRPTENLAQEDIVPIANVEHLFLRLNGGGTNLSAEDRAYSMIKAYWPGIETTIQAIKPRPPETQVALLGTRLSLGLAEDKAALPAQPSVSSLRHLATATDDGSPKAQALQAQRGQICTMFGLPQKQGASTPIAPPTTAPIQTAIERWDSWFLYSDTQPWGLPAVLRSRMASQAPEVYLFLLRLAHHQSDTPDEAVRRKLLGLATAVHWFGLDREAAVRSLWKTPPAEWLDGSAFTQTPHLLNHIRHPQPQSEPTLAGILSPDELSNYIDKDTIHATNISDWRWWDNLVVKPAHQAAHARNPAASQKERDEAVGTRWAQYKDFIGILQRQDYRGSNAVLLMYAQREQMQFFFSDYEPQDADFWAMHNVPWDFDHLLQKNAFTNIKTDNAFMKVCQEWGNTIANLHLLPFEQNRSRKDDELKSILPTDKVKHDEFLRRMHLEPDAPDSTRPLSAFSMHSDALRSNQSNRDKAAQRVTDFVLASRARLLSLYGDWFHTLHIESML